MVIIDDRQKHIENLFAAELQFRLASAVRLAITLGNQPLELPTEWAHGRHHVVYEEIALRKDQAEYAGSLLHQSVTFLMVSVIRDAIVAVIRDPKSNPNPDICSAYQIARLIRNAFAHGPINPVWSIDQDCCNKTFSITDIIELTTTELQGKAFDWRHYGGPLALLRLCRFVRFDILKDTKTPRKNLNAPVRRIYQQGSMVLQQVDEIPRGAVRMEIELTPDSRLSLGDGYFIVPVNSETDKK